MNPLYFIETQSAKLGRWFIECDRDSNSRDQALMLIRTRQVDPVKVLEVDEDAGTTRNVLLDDDFCEAIVHARGHEIANKLFSAADRQAAAWDRARDLRESV